MVKMTSQGGSTMVRSRSFIATPPGATIKEQLNDRGMSQKEFAARMDMSEKHISKLINGEVQLTPEVAVRLEVVLGVPAKFCLLASEFHPLPYLSHLSLSFPAFLLQPVSLVLHKQYLLPEVSQNQKV